MTRGTAIGLIAILLGFLGFSWYVSQSTPARPTFVAGLGELASPRETYNPVRAGEPLPRGFRQLLVRDAILPVYDPQFLPGEAVDWPEDAMVIGVTLGSEAKAYPVGFLNRRELVVDRIDGIPILVSW